MDKISLTATVNDEQLLDFALEYINMFGSDENHNEVADQIVVAYIINEYREKDESFTEDDITRRFSELLTNYVLASLHKKGLIEVNFDGDEPVYRAVKPEELNVNQDS